MLKSIEPVPLVEFFHPLFDFREAKEPATIYQPGRTTNGDPTVDCALADRVISEHAFQVQHGFDFFHYLQFEA